MGARVRTTNRCLRFLIGLAVFIFVSLIPTANAAGADDLVIAAGPETSTYFRVAAGLQVLLGDSDTPTSMRIEETAGSIENLQMLIEGKADLALVQSDVLADYIGRPRAPTEPLKVMPLAKVSAEPVHVLAGPSVGEGDNRIMALAGHRVIIGAPKSGTAFTARRIIDALGIEGIETIEVDTDEELVASLLRNDAAAAFLVVEPPDSFVASLLTQPRFGLVSFNTSQLEKITGSNVHYMPYNIERYTYSKQVDFVRTIAVDTFLVARSSLDLTSAELVAGVILDDLTGASSQLRATDTDISLSHVLDRSFLSYAPQHPGAVRAFERVGWMTWIYVYLAWVIWGLLTLVSLLLCLVAFHFPTRKRIGYLIINLASAKWRRPLRRLVLSTLIWRVSGSVAALLAVWLLGAAGMYYLEQRSNVAFIDFQSAGLSILLYLLSGAEGRLPVTSNGWLLFFCMLLTGAIVGAYLTGEMASQLVKRALGGIMSSKGMAADSIVIIGWSDGVEQVVDQLQRSFQDNYREREIAVLTRQEVSAEIRAAYESKGVRIHQGDALNRDYLMSLQIGRSDCVIIMAEQGEPDPDARTALILLELVACRARQPSAKFRMVAEVMNPRRADVIRLAGGDMVEIVSHHEYAYNLLAQATMTNRVVAVYDDLLSFGERSCEIYILDSEAVDPAKGIPLSLWSGELVGKGFEQVSLAIQRRVSDGASVVLLGYRKNGETLLAPDKKILLGESDSLIVLAGRFPEFKAT